MFIFIFIFLLGFIAQAQAYDCQFDKFKPGTTSKNLEEVNIFVDYQVLPDYELGVDLSRDWGSTSLGISYFF